MTPQEVEKLSRENRPFWIYGNNIIHKNGEYYVYSELQGYICVVYFVMVPTKDGRGHSICDAFEDKSIAVLHCNCCARDKITFDY